MVTNSINLISENVLSFGQAAKRVPPTRAGRPTSPSTIWRWFSHGCRAADGRLVRLEAVRLGGRWVTTLEAIGRFSAQLTCAEPAVLADQITEPVCRTPTARNRASQRAADELSRVGI